MIYRWRAKTGEDPSRYMVLFNTSLRGDLGGIFLSQSEERHFFARKGELYQREPTSMDGWNQHKTPTKQGVHRRKILRVAG